MSTDLGPLPQKRLQRGEKVIFGALDWGLGHATRSIPLLRYIQQKGGQVSVAATGPTAELLKNELPEAEFLDLPGYGITYPGEGKSFRNHLLLQLPKIRRAIRQEAEWLRKAQVERRWDLVISDNRYGFRLPEVPSIFITHQLAPISGMGRMADELLRRTLYHFINRFAECWVPDLEGEPNLAGRLSHPGKLPRIPVRYIGLLSRLEPGTPAKGSDLLFLLSGPEPQRSLLEIAVLREWDHLHLAHPGTKILVRGQPGASATSPMGVTSFDHLPASELVKRMAGAGLIVCRPGYSTIMDLLRLGKTALLIPTPGQTEQEYLADRVSAWGSFECHAQSTIDGHLGDTLSKLRKLEAPAFPGAFDQFKKAIDAFVF